MHQGSFAWYYIFPIIILLINLLFFKKKSTGICIALIMLFFSMFRGDHVGNDTLNYMSDQRIRERGYDLDISLDGFFENIGNRIEFIDILINRLIFNYSLDPRCIIYIYSIITISVLYIALKRIKSKVSFALLLYILLCAYYFSFSASRQMASVSILFYGITFLLSKHKDTLRFLLCYFVSFLIHSSSIFFLPLCFVHNIRMLNRKKCAIFVFIFAVVYLGLNISILPLALKLLNIDYFVNTILEYGDEVSHSFFKRIMDIIKYVPFVYVFYKRKLYSSNMNSRIITTDIWDMLFLISFVVVVICAPLPGLISRFSYIFVVYLCAYTAKFFSLKFNLKYFSVWAAIMISHIGAFGVNSLNSGYYFDF